MKLAIWGGGYAGLSAAVHALDRGFSVCVYEPGYSHSGSLASTGFLHPYTGKFPVKPPDADCWMQATEELLERVERGSLYPFRRRRGLFRPALFPAQEKHFVKMARKYAGITFWSREEANKNIPGIKTAGLYLHQGQQIDSAGYLKALKYYLEKRGVSFFSSAPEPSLQEYDRMILAKGAWTREFALPCRLVKGQTLLFTSSSFSLHCPLIGHPHISRGPLPQQWVVGATYEKEYASPCPDESSDQLLQALSYITLPEDLQIIDRKAGVRLCREGGQGPIVKRVQKRVWVFTALGSKGLLWHAYFGRQLIEEIAAS